MVLATGMVCKFLLSYFQNAVSRQLRWVGTCSLIRSCFFGILAQNGFMWTFGGVGSHFTPTNALAKFDLRTRVWTAVTSDRYWHDRAVIFIIIAVLVCLGMCAYMLFLYMICKYMHSM